MLETKPESRVAMQYGARQSVPCNLTLDRAWKWCIEATVRDMRCARAGHREISAPNLRRMFMRRWADACRLFDIAEDSEERAGLLEIGLVAVRDGGARELARM